MGRGGLVVRPGGEPADESDGGLEGSQSGAADHPQLMLLYCSPASFNLFDIGRGVADGPEGVGEEGQASAEPAGQQVGVSAE